ncbi:unnamed protein product, partial [marine sediment metagenome]
DIKASAEKLKEENQKKKINLLLLNLILGFFLNRII